MASKTILGAVGVVAALGVGGTAWAATGGPSGSGRAGSGQALTAATTAPSGSATTPGAKALARAGSILSRADHATVELKVKGQWVTYSVDRGRVGAVSPTSITIDRPDGHSVTETINSSTKFTGVSGGGAVQTGRAAMVISENGVAVRIRQATGSAAGGAAKTGSGTTGSGVAGTTA